MKATGEPKSASIRIEPCHANASIENAVVTFAQETGLAVLESSQQQGDTGRFSILAIDPVEQFVFPAHERGNPFRALAERTARYPGVPANDSHLPFTGGWLGFFSYEAGHVLEGLPRDLQRRSLLPLASFRLYDAAAILDHHGDQWFAVAVDWPGSLRTKRPTAAERIDRIRGLLERSERTPAMSAAPPACPPPAISNMSTATYFEKFASAMSHIERGDVYQVNLTQRFTTRVTEPSIEVYQRLRRLNPAAYSAFLPFAGGAVLSASPELFLRVYNGQVVTRPIKGTRPRTGNPREDAAARASLERSLKDQAELNMIIDLMRNDLGRVCEYGTVRVNESGRIHAYPGLYHRVGEIEGTVRAGKSWVDVLEATFPGGSVTGAPKIRAMQIIDELEPTARDVYCGCIGAIGLDGSMTMNIAIRTMLHVGEDMHMYAGGAIVADSTPEDEYDETLAKARGMMRAVGCTLPNEARDPQEIGVS